MAQTLQMTSPAFTEGNSIPRKYTCDDEDINPPLRITGVPTGTQSLALIMDDPDAPMGTWDHWLVWNISPDTAEIEEDSVPKNTVLGTNSFRTLEYGGPCPPFGTHRYFFRLYALDTSLNLPQGSKKNALLQAMKGHILDESTLMGRYTRTR